MDVHGIVLYSKEPHAHILCAARFKTLTRRVLLQAVSQTSKCELQCQYRSENNKHNSQAVIEPDKAIVSGLFEKTTLMLQQHILLCINYCENWSEFVNFEHNRDTL